MDEKKTKKIRAKEKKETFSIYLSTTDKTTLQRIADVRHTSVSGLIRVAVDQFLRNVYDDKKEDN